MSPEKIVFREGGVDEFPSWEVHFNTDCDFSHRCRHSIDSRVDVDNICGREYYDYVCTCPRVIVQRNEGGYCATAVCLDCVLEAFVG